MRPEPAVFPGITEWGLVRWSRARHSGFPKASTHGPDLAPRRHDRRLTARANTLVRRFLLGMQPQSMGANPRRLRARFTALAMDKKLPVDG